MNRKLLVDYDEVRKLFDEEYKQTMQLIQDGETHLDNLAEGFTEADRVIFRLMFFHPQTNADRIRAMSDEELAEFVGDICLCSHIQYVDRKFCESRAVCGTDCIVDWLKQPVKDGEG